MVDRRDIKVVLKQITLSGSTYPIVRQGVATVYIAGSEYRVSAPPEARGEALEWASHFTVRQPGGFDGEIDVPGDPRAAVLEAVLQELRNEKDRQADRAVGMHPDGLHHDALICLKGHVLHCSGGLFDLGAYCTICGETCIHECPNCQEPIRGMPVRTSVAAYRRPQYCHRCGHPYPWTEHSMKVARELIEHDNKLSPEDREKVWEGLKDVMADPRDALVPAKRKLIGITLEKASQFVREFVLDLLAKTITEMAKGT